MRIVLDAEACTGHGRCYTLVPELFDADERGHCLILKADVSGDDEQLARNAADNCPERALTVED
jgi:ferredoxin